MSVSKRIINRRCDEPMRRSKEQCYTRSGVHWRCTKQCKTCMCCIEKEYNGDESHVNMAFKGVKYDELKKEGE